MTHKVLDRAKEAASTSGTGTFTLTGAMSGFAAILAQLADTDTTWYCATAGTQWEIGLGTRGSATTLARTTILSNSNGDTSAVAFSTAPVVFCTLPAAAIGPVAFSAYQSGTGQSIPGTTFTKVAFNSKEYDTNGYFNASTSTFQPAVPGYYQLSATVGYTAQTTAGAPTMITIYKNGAEHKRGTQLLSTAYAVNMSALVYLNGTSDYAEIYAYVPTGMTVATSAAAQTHFEGVLVKAAG